MSSPCFSQSSQKRSLCETSSTTSALAAGVTIPSTCSWTAVIEGMHASTLVVTSTGTPAASRTIERTAPTTSSGLVGETCTCSKILEWAMIPAGLDARQIEVLPYASWISRPMAYAPRSPPRMTGTKGMSRVGWVMGAPKSRGVGRVARRCRRFPGAPPRRGGLRSDPL